MIFSIIKVLLQIVVATVSLVATIVTLIGAVNKNKQIIEILDFVIDLLYLISQFISPWILLIISLVCYKRFSTSYCINRNVP